MSDRPDPSGRQDWGDIDILAVWEASRGVLQDQVEVIEQTVVAGIEGRLGLDRQREACREAHKLAGSLGTFGFRDASRLARDLEMGLAPSELLDPSRALDLSRLVVGLRVEIAEPPTAPTGFLADGDAPSVLVVDIDADQARRVVEAAAGRNHSGGSTTWPRGRVKISDLISR